MGKKLKIFLVGGAVRDQLLNIPVKERDWVVIGSSVDEMLAKGFKPVGKEFPVFCGVFPAGGGPAVEMLQLD